MPFPDTPYGRVARHLPQGLDVVGQQKGPTTGPRGRKRSLGPGVAATDNDDIELGGELHRFEQENRRKPIES
jgi:hypothetical protein